MTKGDDNEGVLKELGLCKKYNEWGERFAYPFVVLFTIALFLFGVFRELGHFGSL